MIKFTYYNITMDEKEKDLKDLGYEIVDIDVEQNRDNGKCKFVFNCK